MRCEQYESRVRVGIDVVDFRSEQDDDARAGVVYNKIYVFSHTDPYTTIDGVSRTTSLSYRDSSQFVSASSQLSSEQISAAIRWAYPISEYQSLQAGVSANEVSLLTTQGYSSQ